MVGAVVYLVVMMMMMMVVVSGLASRLVRPGAATAVPFLVRLAATRVRVAASLSARSRACAGGRERDEGAGGEAAVVGHAAEPRVAFP